MQITQCVTPPQLCCSIISSDRSWTGWSLPAKYAIFTDFQIYRNGISALAYSHFLNLSMATDMHTFVNLYGRQVLIACVDDGSMGLDIIHHTLPPASNCSTRSRKFYTVYCKVLWSTAVCFAFVYLCYLPIYLFLCRYPSCIWLCFFRNQMNEQCIYVIIL